MAITEKLLSTMFLFLQNILNPVELKQDRSQLASLKSQQIEIEQRIENNRKTNLFGRNRGILNEERDRLTQKIEKTEDRIT